jgi:glycosyltransferase involved in cell wall biosynthesis
VTDAFDGRAERDVCVTVGVLTYLRPASLAELLPLLLAQLPKLGPGYRAEVLVVDNDPAGSARSVASAQAASNVRYVCEKTPGISAARNRALAESSDLLVFIDDDERPRDDWLVPLVHTWEASRAAVVSGRVVVEFAEQPDRWLLSGGFFDRRALPTGTPITVASTNNLLIDVHQVRCHGVSFALDLGLAGGEDTLFTRQLDRSGAKMVWCNDSAVTDLVPTGRLTRRWVLSRAYSHGNSAAVVALRLCPRGAMRLRVRLSLASGGAARVVVGTALWGAGQLSRSVRPSARGLRTSYRGAGMLAGALGWLHLEYKRV